jgi:hypothetical protein
MVYQTSKPFVDDIEQEVRWVANIVAYVELWAPSGGGLRGARPLTPTACKLDTMINTYAFPTILVYFPCPHNYAVQRNRRTRDIRSVQLTLRKDVDQTASYAWESQ